VAAAPALRLPASVRQHAFAGGAQAARALAAAVAQALAQGLRQRGSASLLVAGGRTPAPFLDELSGQPLDWSRVSVGLTDDRWVAADHADSNEGMVRRHLLRNAAATARLVPLVDPKAQPESHLAVAERALAEMPRPFDAVVLGMGADGHTASLFPGAPGTAAALDARRPGQVALITPAGAAHRRISLTLRALLDAREVMILIQGEDKRAAIERAAQSDPAQHPIAAFLQQAAVPVHVYHSA
jgi:6-phosphogluconolactonase